MVSRRLSSRPMRERVWLCEGAFVFANEDEDGDCTSRCRGSYNPLGKGTLVL